MNNCIHLEDNNLEIICPDCNNIVPVTLEGLSTVTMLLCPHCKIEIQKEKLTKINQ